MTSGSVTCARSPGRTRRSMSSRPASAVSGARRRRSWRARAGASSRRTTRAHGVGPPQGVARRLGARAVPARGRAKVENQAAMVSLGRPGAGEELLSRHGFADVQRVSLLTVWEYADPEPTRGPSHRWGPRTRRSRTSAKRPFSPRRPCCGHRPRPRRPTASRRDQPRRLRRSQAELSCGQPGSSVSAGT